MNISLLKTFMTVARLKHFGKAADSLFLTQSAVSARIKMLEESLDVALFDRKRNAIELTAAGRRLASVADSMIRQWENVKQEINLIQNREQLFIKVGCVFDLWDLHLRQWINHRVKSNDDIVFNIDVGSAVLIGQKLFSGDIDAAVVFDPPFTQGLNSVHIADIELVLVSEKECKAGEANCDNFIWVDWGSSFSDSYKDLLGSPLQSVISFNMSRMAQDYLLDNGGMAFLARPQVEKELLDKKLFMVEGVAPFKRAIFFCYRNHHPFAQRIEQLI